MLKSIKREIRAKKKKIKKTNGATLAGQVYHTKAAKNYKGHAKKMSK